MSTTYKGINYWPCSVNFYETDAVELIEAKYGIKADGTICKLLCKIFKEGYFIPWGSEQSMIFARKLGGEVSTEEMNDIIMILIEKDFFDKMSFEKYHILTSAEIQRIWLEATYRRKRDLNTLPYLLNKCDAHSPAEADTKSENDNISTENAYISKQSKAKEKKAEHSRASKEEEIAASLPIEIPEYAWNKSTHNLEGLLENLKLYKVTNPKDVAAILALSDYGRKGLQVWITLSSTNWAKIKNPGLYIISTLKPDKD